ncbi:MAG: hypothetical protein C4537_05535 [Acholeplasma sp.]|jgi:NTE family protein|nr:MAG: hypothetical protein C4537_05535 [Acholeplasma sp.]
MVPKIGLALGGGGSRGSYQIGVLRALEEAGILKEIEHVAGSSIGAINTMMVMAKFSFDRMIETWETITNEDVYGHHFDHLQFSKVGIFSLKELFDRLTKQISLKEIRDSKIQGYVTATKIRKGSMIEQVMLHRMEKEVFHLNNFNHPYKAVLASASIPLIFGSTEIDESFYVDGGIKDNCPVDVLIEQGCNIILAIPIDGRFHPKMYEDSPILLINFETKKLFSIILLDILDFKKEGVKDNADYGYLIGKHMIEKLKHEGIFDGLHWHIDDKFQHIFMTKDEEKHLDKGEDVWN